MNSHGGGSSGEASFDPEDNRARGLLGIFLDAARLLALGWAAVFVLLTITDFFLESPLAGISVARHPCREAGILGCLPGFPAGLIGGQLPVFRPTLSSADSRKT